MNPEGRGNELTALIQRMRDGDSEAGERVADRVYSELLAIAAGCLRRQRPGGTLQTTALANEAWIALAEQSGAAWRHRGEFFAMAATMMRRTLARHARDAGRLKRGGGRERLDFQVVIDAYSSEPLDPGAFLDLDAALDALAKADGEAARLIELQFFSDLTLVECAEHLGTGESTARRMSRAGIGWLRRRLRGGPS